MRKDTGIGMEEKITDISEVNPSEKFINGFKSYKGLGISGSTLKIIAMVLMLADHIGAFIVERFMINAGLFNCHTVDERALWIKANASLYYGYEFLRGIGRLPFPIFCFLLVEGYKHTRSKVKYALRLALFAAISEIPFNLCYSGTVSERNYQNVFFTLFFGFLTIWAMDTVFRKMEKGKLRYILCSLIAAAGAVIAYFCHVDYHLSGVITIVIIFLMCSVNNVTGALFGCMSLTVFSMNEVYAFLMIPLVSRYNGKRGLKLKWIFYIFYPAHLLILYLIALRIGLV